MEETSPLAAELPALAAKLPALAAKLPALAAVICAAGTSSRMGGVKKEFCICNADKVPGGINFPRITVLGNAVRTFASVPSIKTIVIVIPENSEESARAALMPEHLPKVIFVNGGKTRRASVFNALSLLEEHSPRYVLIHDGARPWVSVSLIESIFEAVKKHGAVIPLLPLTDTPKECDTPLEFGHQGVAQPVFIKNHLKRKNTGIAQTPQAFRFPEILSAHKQAAALENDEFTDDAEIWGRFCGPVAVIPGEPENRKITFKEDLQ